MVPQDMLTTSATCSQALLRLTVQTSGHGGWIPSIAAIKMTKTVGFTGAEIQTSFEKATRFAVQKNLYGNRQGYCVPPTRQAFRRSSSQGHIAKSPGYH